MPNIIVIGASAGGIEALREIIFPLPGDLQAAIFIAMHISPLAPSILPQILSTSGRLTAVTATDGEVIEPSRIYVAPPDRHLLIEPGRMRLTRGPRENRHRPAIDPLFRSAARAYGERVAGIVLTGMLEDGAIGLNVIKSQGGMTIVQDPFEAMFPSMPLSAIKSADIDYILLSSEIAAQIIKMVDEPWKPVELKRAQAIKMNSEISDGEKKTRWKMNE